MLDRRGVLVPVENTLESLRALDWAIKEAYREGDKFWILHVILTHRRFSSSFDGHSPRLMGQVEEDVARSWIENRFIPILQSAQVDHEVIIAKGQSSLTVAEVICQHAERLPVHLVVMSSKTGRSGAVHYEGSLLEECVASSPVPVLQWRSQD